MKTNAKIGAAMRDEDRETLASIDRRLVDVEEALGRIEAQQQDDGERLGRIETRTGTARLHGGGGPGASLDVDDVLERLTTAAADLRRDGPPGAAILATDIEGSFGVRGDLGPEGVHAANLGARILHTIHEGRAILSPRILRSIPSGERGALRRFASRRTAEVVEERGHA